MGRSRFEAACLAGAVLISVASLVAWASQAAPGPWAIAAAGLSWAASSAWAFAAWWRTPARPLAWDGECWRLGAAADAGEVQVLADLQQWMLLRWTASRRRSAWLWLERRGDPARWDAVRRAVYSRARPEAPAGDIPVPATP